MKIQRIFAKPKHKAMKTLRQAAHVAVQSRTRCDSFRQSRIVVDHKLTTELFYHCTTDSDEVFNEWLLRNWERVKHAFPTNHRKHLQKLLNQNI